MRRQFQRQTYKLESTDKKLNRELKALINKKGPVVIKEIYLGEQKKCGSEHPQKPKIHPEI